MKTPDRPALTEIRTRARFALDLANLFGLKVDVAVEQPEDLCAYADALAMRDKVAKAIADAHAAIDYDCTEDDVRISGATRNILDAEDMLRACDVILHTGSSAPMAVAS